MRYSIDLPEMPKVSAADRFVVRRLLVNVSIALSLGALSWGKLAAWVVDLFSPMSQELLFTFSIAGALLGASLWYYVLQQRIPQRIRSRLAAT